MMAGIQNGAATLEDSLVVSQKVKQSGQAIPLVGTNLREENVSTQKLVHGYYGSIT